MGTSSSFGVVITDGGTRGRLHDNHLFHNQGYDVAVQSGADPLLSKNMIHDSPGCGISFANAMTKGTLVLNDVWGHGKLEVSIQDGAAPLLQKNLIHHGFGFGVRVQDRLSGGKIIDNEIYNFPSADGNCLGISGSLSLEITENRIHGAGGDGVIITNGSRCLLRGNSVFNHGKTAISVEGGADPLITLCKIADSDYGVTFKGGETIGRLLRNQISGCTKMCILIGPSNPIISGNSIHRGGSAGVGVYGEGASGRITANSIWSCGDTGVRVFEGGRPSLTGNFIIANAHVGVQFQESGVDVALMGTGNVFSHNACDVAVETGGDAAAARNAEGERVLMTGEGSAILRAASYYDRALCSACGADGAALKRCSGCVRFGAPFSPRYCGPACQKAH